MDKAWLEKIKTKLLGEKMKIINGGVLTSKEDLQISSDDLADEADLASSVIHQQVTFNMRQRELSKLRSIEEALDRIEAKSYGHCDDCDEPIGKKRLENQPWAILCITHAEEQERESQHFARIG